MKSAEELWESIVSYIKNSDNTKKNYITILSSVKSVSISDNELTLEVVNDFVVTIIKTHFAKKIEEALNKEFPGLRYRIIVNAPSRESFISKQPVFPSMLEETQNKNAAPQKIMGRQSRYETMFNNKYTFDSFVVGESNRYAYTVCQSVSKNPGARNPVFIYGGVGLGKTHLIQAIGQDFIKNYPKLKIAYVSSEMFTNEFIDSLKDKKTNAFRDKYRKIDLLLIDDVQFFKGKEQTQEEFFHTFNDLYENKKQIVLTSDTHPAKLQGLEDRLTSRFGMGFVVDIQPPDLELRTAILKSYADRSMVKVSDDVIMYLAQGVNSNIRALEGAFNSVLAFAGIMNKPVSKDLVDQVLKDIIKENSGGKISISWIQKRVAEFYEISEDELVGKRRSQNLVLPRQVAMRMCQIFTDSSLNQIGEKFGGRDHTTVMHSCDKVNKMLKTDKLFENEFERLKHFIDPNK